MLQDEDFKIIMFKYAKRYLPFDELKNLHTSIKIYIDNNREPRQESSGTPKLIL